MLKALIPNTTTLVALHQNSTLEGLGTNSTVKHILELNPSLVSFLALEKNIFLVLLVATSFFSFLASSRAYHYLQLLTCHDTISSSTTSYRSTKSSSTSFTHSWPCLSSGIFLSVLFLDLFPSVSLRMSSTLVHSERFPQFVVVTSFLLVMTVEQAVMHWKEKLEQKEKSGCEQTSPLLSKCRKTLLSQNTVRSLFLVFSLSLHNCLEGVSLGQSWSSPTSLSLATVLHKSLVTSCVGFSLARLSPTLLMFQGLLYCGSSLGGVIVALVASLEGAGAHLALAVLQGVAAGIFLYILFFEILPHQLNGAGRRLRKVFFATCGFLAAAAIVIFV